MTDRDDHYKAGGYWVHCDICGFQRRRGECTKDWEGKLVCADTCHDERNPQERIQPRAQTQRVLDARYADPVTVTDNQVQPEDL